MLEDLEGEKLKYETAEEFLADIEKEFRRGNKETVKVVELKRLEQGEKIIKEFIQEFQRVVKESGYERRSLVEKFKRGMNRTICQRLMESEWQPSSIEQKYNRAIILNRN